MAPGDVRPNGPADRARPGVRAGPPRTKLRGEVREDEPLARYSTYRIGGPATVVLPAAAGGRGHRASRRARGRRRPGSPSGWAPTSCCPTRGSTRSSSGWGRVFDALRPGRRRAGPSARGCRRRWPPGRTGGGGIRRAAHLRRRAGHRRRRRVHERRLPRRRLGGGGRAGDVVDARARTRPGSRATSRSATGGAVSTGGSCWRRWCACGPRPQATARRADRRDVRVAPAGTPFNQPCCGSVFKNPSGPSWKREGGPRTAGQLIEAAGPQGRADRRGRGVADARELLRQHRRCHGGRRAGAHRAGAGEVETRFGCGWSRR